MQQQRACVDWCHSRRALGGCIASCLGQLSKGQQILKLPLLIVLIVLIALSTLASGLAYMLSRQLGVVHCIAGS